MLKEERIISALYGLAGAVLSGKKTENTDKVFIQSLARPVTDPGFDRDTAGIIAQNIHEEKFKVSPGCKDCASPCGNTSDLDMSKLYSEGETLGIKLDIISRAEKLAAAFRNEKTADKETVSMLYRAVSYMGYELDADFLAEFLGELNDTLNKKTVRDIEMIRKIIKIDADKCNGCGACAAACHEGAIHMQNGKAVLTREDYCDGLGDCLPACPVNAITFEERQAATYDRAAVAAAKAEKPSAEGCKSAEPKTLNIQGGCPGSRPQTLNFAPPRPLIGDVPSQLAQWPCQIKLAPVKAPYYDGAKLLIAADCTAYACATFHRDYMRGKVTLIGCPKLDMVDYSEKLCRIIQNNDIKSVTLVRMEVPCCGGLENAVKKALQNSGKFLPWQVITLSIKGQVLDS